MASADRPPILRTLLIFVAGLALVTGLAALSYTPEGEVGGQSAVAGQPQR